MSVVGEVVGVIACVAAIVSAYKDGGTIIDKIKVKRAAKRAPPPPRLLVECIDQAPNAIESEKRRGIERFGPEFEEGDQIAVIALQQITIQLQGSLLGKLRNAAFDDEMADFTHLCDAAELGRDRTVTALLDLRQRLMESSSITEMNRLSLRANTMLPKSSTEPAVPPSRVIPQSPRGAAHGGDASPDAEESQQPRQRSKFSIPRLIKRRTHSNPNNRADKADRDERRRPSNPNLSPQTSEQIDVHDYASSSNSGDTQKPKYTYSEGEDNPFEIWGSKQSRDIQRREPHSPSSGNSSPALKTRMISYTPTNFSGHSTSSIAMPQPTPENDYLGFCKGAWKLQSGDTKAMGKCRDYAQSPQSNVQYLSCTHSKCAFATHLNIETIWTDVCTYQQKCLKVRWPFLAKSHVAQKQLRDEKYSYQCLFCTFLGQQTPVMLGIDLYLDHISQQHRGTLMSEVILYKTRCINDRVCDDSEEFDINLFPPKLSEQADRQRGGSFTSEVHHGLAKTKSDAKDSMFSNEPWNEGPSGPFHSGGFQHAELE